MREKLATLSLVQLKELAKAEGLKGTSAMKKAELVELLAEHAKKKEQVTITRKRTAAPREAAARETAVRENAARGEHVSDVSAHRSTTQADVQSGLDSGMEASGILEVMSDGFGFIRSDNFLPGEDDIYVAPSQIRKFGLRTGDIISGQKKIKTPTEKFAALLYLKEVNGIPIDKLGKRPSFENLTPVFPNQRIHLDRGENTTTAMRVVDLISPIVFCIALTYLTMYSAVINFGYIILPTSKVLIISSKDILLILVITFAFGDLFLANSDRKILPSSIPVSATKLSQPSIPSSTSTS